LHPERLDTMPCRPAALALFLLLAGGSLAATADAVSEPAELEPQYIDLLGSWVRPDSGRHTKSHGYGATFIYGSHVSGPFWVEGRLTGALFETGDSAGTDFYHYGGGIDGVATLGDRTGWTPFGLIGVGAIYDDVQPDHQDSLNLRTDFGLGFVTPALTDRGLKLRAEGRGLHDTFRSGQLDWQVSLGISIPLGYREVVERVVEREVVREVGRPAAPPPDSDGDGIADSLDHCPDTLAGGAVDPSGCLIRADQTIVIGDVNFEHDSARLTPSAEESLGRVAASLHLEPDVRFEIAGHTDGDGSDEYNDRLSQARANSVLRFLTGRGIAAERMSAHGYGERQPIDTNDTADGRARNRRVEFRFLARGSR
jgi:OOP family OmpA-OmpF porin